MTKTAQQLKCSWRIVDRKKRSFGLLRDRLRWLRVPERVRYKLCLLVFKAVHGTAPEYLRELCRSNAEDAARSRLRSTAHNDLQVPCSFTNFSDRTFAWWAAWNRLPATVRSSDTLLNFKYQLKAHFFWRTISFSFPFISSVDTGRPWIGLTLQRLTQILTTSRIGVDATN